MGQEALARRLGLTARQIRYWRKKGYVPAVRREGRTWIYDLASVQRLALIAQLLTGGATPQSVLAAIRALECDAPSKLRRPLSALKVFVAGTEILVGDGQSLFNPVTGDLCHPVLVAEVFGRAAQIARQERVRSGG